MEPATTLRGRAPAHFATLYDQIHEMARRALGRSPGSATLQPTAMVHEIYLRMARCPDASRWEPTQCLKIAARALRSSLVDHARRRRTRQDAARRIAADALLDEYEHRALDLLALEEALRVLARRNALEAELVTLRFFGGAEMAECAAALGMSERSAHRAWSRAREWLYRRLRGGEEARP